MKQLECILLVDDDETANFYNQHVINEAMVASTIKTCTNGKEALDYIQSSLNGEKDFLVPNLIFLDINMPVMDGFEFLEAYNLLDKEEKNSVIICMLTTSLHKNDQDRISSFGQVSDYIPKPLSKDVVMNIYNKHFN